MLDTIRLKGSEYSLKEDAGPWVVKTRIDTGEVSESCSTPHLHCDIGPDRVLRLQIHSAPVLLHGTSLREVTEKDFPAFNRALTRVLQEEAALSLDIPDFDVTRADFCRNLRVKHSPADYISALSPLSMSRREKKVYTGESVTWNNDSRALIFYDKVQAVLDKEKKPEIIALAQSTPPILRAEARVKQGKLIRELTGTPLPRLREVWNRELCRDYLLKEYDALAPVSDGTVPLDFDGEVRQVQEFRARYRRGAATMYLLTSYGVPGLIARFQGDWRLVLKMLLGGGYRRSQANEIVRRWRAVQVQGMPRDRRKLLREVRRLLAA